jgi:prefoldin subunit 5
MQVWRKGRELVSLLERKRQILQGDIAKLANQIESVAQEIAVHQQAIADINQQIKNLIPIGLFNRADIYKGIRQQGILLAEQQLILHKIDQLQDEKDKLETELEEYCEAMNLLDKKQYKLSYYLRPLRREYIRRYENDAENEILERASYVIQDF